MSRDQNATHFQHAEAEIRSASEAWISTFNRGDYVGCSAAYTKDAHMQGRPLADVQGRSAIADFWQGVISQDPGELIYEDTRVHVLGPAIAVLSARWSMANLGHGIITLERWEKQTTGEWLLAEDIFELAGTEESEAAD